MTPVLKTTTNSPNVPDLVHMLNICREAAEREEDADTFVEASAVLVALWRGEPGAEAKALTIIEAYVAVMNDQLKEQGL